MDSDSVVEIEGFESLTEKDCLVNALESDEKNSKAWLNMATLLNMDESVTITGVNQQS